MQINRTRTRHFLLSVLGALAVAVGVVAVAPSAQAQVAPEPPSINKECTPNPVQIGQQITCIIDVVAAPGTYAAVDSVTDTFPAGLAVTGATSQTLVNGVPTLPIIPCDVAGNTVTCPGALSPVGVTIQNFPGMNQSYEVTVEAKAEQCGTFQNTATATGQILEPRTFPITTYSVQDTEEITVEGCEEVGGGGAAEGAAPITQEGEQESEAGEIDQSFDVS